MDNLHMSVMAVILYFNLPGSLGTKSQWILLDTHHHSDCRWDGELSVNCSFTGISIVPEEVSQTVITADFSYNNIKTFMCNEGRNEEWVLKHLNLSNNLISELSLTAFRNLPVLETLNLNGNAIHTLTLDIPTPAHGSKNYGKGSCLLPALKVLSIERNNLNTVPRGLGLLQSLQTVHLSSNGIHQIDLNDFQNCSQLKEIDLKKNKITKIHPCVFRDLNKLQFVDLRENALTTPLPQILMSLNFFRLEVDLSNNAWIFNCRLNAFKHLFHFLFNSTRKKWSISYNKSANNSQKPLLYLSSSHLNCSNSVLLKRAVIPTGKTSVLNCDFENSRGNEVSWWTPKGRISKDNSLPHMTVDKMNNLVIYNAEKTSEGLYLCICYTTKTYLIYNIQIKERPSAFLVRRARDTNTAFRKGRTEQDFVLAVCLSVLITFVCAFCLGIFARPYLVSLCRLLRRNKNPDSEHSYSNRAFSDETLSRECSASKPTNTKSNLFICDEKFSRSACIFPTETSTLHENVIDSSVHAPNTEEEYQKQGNNEVNGKKKTVPSDIKTSISSDENIHVDDNGLFSVRRDSPEIKCIVSQNEPISITKFMLGRQSYDEQLGLNGNINATSDVGDFILPSSCKREKNIENLSVHQTTENSALTEYNCKMQHTNEKDTSADLFGNSSDEGSLFTMSDCSSLADFELEQPAVSDNLPVCQLSPEQADTNSGTEQLTLPEPPNIAAELQHIGRNEDENNAYSETTINCGSDTIMPETASAYTDKCSNRASTSDSDAISSSSQEVPAMFDYFTNEESTIQNSISDSLHNQNTDFGNTLLSLKLFPTYDTENTPEEGELHLYQFPIETQYSPQFSPTEQKENEPEGSTDKCIDRNYSEKNHGEGNITLRRNTSMSEDNFTFAPIDTDLNEIVKKTSLLHSSNESPLQLLPEYATEKHFTVIPEKEDLPPEGKQVNTTKACADKMQRGFNEKDWEGYIEVQDASNCSLPKETQTCNATAALLLLHSSGKTQPAFSTEDWISLDQSDKDAYSLSVPQGFFSESTRYSSHSFPQKTTGNIISNISTNSKMEDDTTLTGLENNFTTAVNNQNSSEKLSQKHQTNLGQGQFFVKKKRAFDGFANVLQSRRTNFNS